MKKIEFINDPIFGRHEHVTDNKFGLLGLFIGMFRYPSNIQEIIDMLEEVKSGNKTWEEVNDGSMYLQVGYDSGDLKCDRNTAYFISDARPETEPSMEMPLQELIDLMKEWKAFMS